jgi:predicted kinase
MLSLLFSHSRNVQNDEMEQHLRPVLIAFSGLPGTGKSTISIALAARLRAVYLRIDTIEQTLKAAGTESMGPAGYAVANALAEANLLLGQSVVADCVNPVRDSRVGWIKVAARASARLVDIQLICSDVAEHRRRVESRLADIPGHILPTWEAVTQHEFETRDDDHLLLDTATQSPAELIDRCYAHVAGKRGDQ